MGDTRNAFGCDCGRQFCNGVDFHTRRGVAMNQSAAMRELWRQHRAMSCYRLRAAHDRYVWLLTNKQARSVRPANIQKVDLWYLRLIRNEMGRRGMGWVEPFGFVLTGR